jgi:uncharacterized protein
MRHVLIVAGLVLSLASVAEAKPSAPTTPKPATTSAAQSPIAPSKRVLIDKLLSVTEQEKLFQQSLNLAFSQLQTDLPALMDQATTPPATNSGATSGATSGAKPDASASPVRKAVQSMLDRVMPKFIQEVQQSVSFKELVEQVYYPMYDRHFSEGELKDILAFYESPTGKRTIAVMPQLVQESMQKTNQIMMPKLMGIMQRLMAEEEKVTKSR